MPVKYSIVKDLSIASAISRTLRSTNCRALVGLGRIELPTSPLSGVRSSQLSYRPRSELIIPGGAGRDRTGDLLNANQALSQLSYSPKKKFNRGQLDAVDHEINPWPLEKTRVL
jgi:hypothetical protein